LWTGFQDCLFGGEGNPENSRRYWRREQAQRARGCVVCRREDGWLALLAAGNTVLAAAMRQWQREAGRQPPAKRRCVREDGELPRTNAANVAISAKRCGVWGM